MIAEKAKETVKETAKQIWYFFRTAGVLQAVVDGKAFRNLKDLPNENWAVLSCPTSGLDFDAKTLACIDTNKDGHIRIEEILGTIDWLDKRIVDMADLLQDSDVVKLSSFADTPEGNALRKAAEELLKVIGKEGAQELSLKDVMTRQASFLAAEFNGDGVLVPDAVKDPARAKLYGEIVAATGGAADRSGKQGVDKATLDAFYKACADHLAWIEKGRAEAATVFPIGDATAAGVAALEAVRAKVEDYFHRCRLVDFDAAASGPLNSKESDYAAVAQGDMADGAGTIATFPLSRVAAGAPLRLREGVNPEWVGRISAFADAVVKPLLGDVDAISEADWRKLCAALAPHIAWKSAIAGANVASLGEARIKEVLADTKAKDDILALIDTDLSYAPEINQLDDLEKFVRLHANLNHLLNNFVNFSDYYNPDKSEIYRAGRLYIDGRVCRECVYVADAGAHSTLAAASKMLLLYCNITRPQTGEKKVVCAAVTAGFSTTLWVGRNGIFYDAEGKDWNAVIVKICESQTSLKEAFWAPWIKICDLINDQIKKLLSSKETAMMSAATTKVSTIGTETPPPAAPSADQKRDGAAMASSVAAIGIALGIIGSAIGGLISALKGISFWYGVLGVIAIVLVVSGPSVILAWFKLRARDFAPVLNACGWAINKKMRMPMRLSRVFTHEAVVPEGSNIDMTDPYVEKHFWRNTLITILVLAIALVGILICRPAWIPEPCHGWLGVQKSSADGKTEQVMWGPVRRVRQWFGKDKGETAQKEESAKTDEAPAAPSATEPLADSATETAPAAAEAAADAAAEAAAPAAEAAPEAAPAK